MTTLLLAVLGWCALSVVAAGSFAAVVATGRSRTPQAACQAAAAEKVAPRRPRGGPVPVPRPRDAEVRQDARR